MGRAGTPTPDSGGKHVKPLSQRGPLVSHHIYIYSILVDVLIQIDVRALKSLSIKNAIISAVILVLSKSDPV